MTAYQFLCLDCTIERPFCVIQILHVLTGFITMPYEGGPARASVLDRDFPKSGLHRGNKMIASHRSHKTIQPRTSHNISCVADYFIYDKSLTMDNPLPLPKVARGRGKKKKVDEETKDDVPADGSNDSDNSKKHSAKRPKMYIEQRDKPVGDVQGIPNHSQFAKSRSKKPPRVASKSANKGSQGKEKHKLVHSFCLTQGQIDTDTATLGPVQTENANKKYIRLYTNWEDYDPWCLMAFGNGIEPLKPDERVSFLSMDTLRRCKDYLTYNVRRPTDRNCIVPFERVRARNCACQQQMQDGMVERYPSHFAARDEEDEDVAARDEEDEDKPVDPGTFVYENPEHPISTDVTDYYTSRLQFLLACRDLMEPDSAFTDRQIYRHLRQSTVVVQGKEKWGIVFLGDITKKDALALMTPSCVFHLLEPLGVIESVPKSIPQTEERRNVIENILKDKDVHEYDDLKNLNYLPGLRAYAAFFTPKASKTFPFPGRHNGSNLLVSSVEYAALEKVEWHKKSVAARLEIFEKDDRGPNTLSGSLCHRMDFNHRFQRICEALMTLHAYLLTKVQYNLVGIGDQPNMMIVYENFRSLYGHVMMFHRFESEYETVVGCLKPMKSTTEPLSVVASGNLVYSHVKSVCKDHGYRHSVIVSDDIISEREGVNQAAKKQLVNRKDYETREARAEQISKNRQDSVADYLKELRKSTSVENFLDLYNPKVQLEDWDDKIDRFGYVCEKTTEEGVIRIVVREVDTKEAKRIAVKYNRVAHTVIALHGMPLYHHETDFGNYNADYCAFLIPASLRSKASQFHRYILHENGYEVSGMIGNGMQRVNGNDNLLTYPDFETCAEFFKRFDATSGEVNEIVKDLTKAIQEGCEIALFRRTKGVLNNQNCLIRMRLQCNVPDLSKTTMECKKTAYPLKQIFDAAAEGVTVLSGILPLHNTGLLHQAYSGTMKTSAVTAGTRFHKDTRGSISFRGLPVFIAPDSFVLYPGALPIASGMPLTPGISYFIEIDIQLGWKNDLPVLPSTTLTDRSGLDCYLTSAGRAMSLLNEEGIGTVKQKLQEASKHPGETSFAITKDVTLPSVVYWSKHGTPSQLGEVLFDQIDPVMETLGRSIWFGNFEYPTRDGENKKPVPRLGSFQSVSQQPADSQPQLQNGSISETGQPSTVAEQVPLQVIGTQQLPTANETSNRDSSRINEAEGAQEHS